MGLLRKIFGDQRNKGQDEHITPQMTEKIIQEYGTILQTQAPTPGCVADVSKLPYPKLTIKKALIVALRSTFDS